MVTSYALPLNGASTYSHHIHGHSRSHHRKAVPERLPLAPTSTNGVVQQNGGVNPKDFLSVDHRTHNHTRSLPLESWTIPRQSSHQRHQSEVPSPTRELPGAVNPIPHNSRPSLSQSRQNSYSMPTNDVKRRHSTFNDGESSSQWISLREASTSILIILPYILLSLVSTSLKWPSFLQSSPISFESIEIDPSKPFAAWAITAATLILVGTIGNVSGKTVGSRQGLEAKEHNFGHNWTSWATLRKLSGRVLAVGLPFCAVAQLGADRVALFSLLAVAGSLDITVTSIRSWKDLFVSRKWTLCAFAAQIMSDLTGYTRFDNPSELAFGYVLLGLCVLVLPLYFAPEIDVANSMSPVSTKKAAPRFSSAEPKMSFHPMMIGQSLMVSSPEEANITLAAGAITALICGAFLVVRPDISIFSTQQIPGFLLIAAVATLSLLMSDPRSLQSNKKYGLLLGSILSFLLMFQNYPQISFALEGAAILSFWLALNFDTHSASGSYSKQYHHLDHRSAHEEHHSRFTGLLLGATNRWPLLHGILVEKDSRRIFYFMCLNFGFMLVQTFYAVVTGSLGLLSDSIHMLFDCLALVVGLCAAVMSKWPPSVRFPYGFSKMDTLAGFANGVFLMLISVEICYEAIERLVEGSEMQRIGELLTVSSLGLVVNLIGMTAFGHAHHGHGHSHGHSHGDHGHSHDVHDHSHIEHKHADKKSAHDHSHGHHSHEKHSHDSHKPSPLNLNNFTFKENQQHSPAIPPLNTASSPLPYSQPATPAHPPALTHNHGHSHHHHGGNDNMHGIFLHVLADTLGSVAVVVSTILIHYTGWAGFDPLASCLIAILIFASAIPLVTSSARTLLLTVPEDTEFDLRETLAGISGLRGVINVGAPRFWLDDGGDGAEVKCKGVMHIIAPKGAGELEDVRARAVRYLESRGVDAVVQVEREGEGRCWCGGSGGGGGSGNGLGTAGSGLKNGRTE